MKKLKWLGGSYRRLLEFPKDAIRQAGYQLGKFQRGLELTDWKVMSDIGPGVAEIRIHDPHEHRVIYVAAYSGEIGIPNR